MIKLIDRQIYEYFLYRKYLKLFDWQQVKVAGCPTPHATVVKLPRGLTVKG